MNFAGWEKVMLGVVVSVVGLLLWPLLNIDTRDPIPFGYARVEVLNSPLTVGKKLELRVWRVKVRDDCKVKAERYVLDQDGKAVELPSPVSEGGSADKDYVHLIFDTSRLHAGEWVAYARVIYYCPDDMTFVHEQQGAPFRILELIP